jgi:molybdopterin adenylyltransferase
MIDYGLLSIGNQPDGLNAVRSFLTPEEYQEVFYESVQDDNASIRRALRTFCDTRQLPLVLTVGGSHVGVRERVPEITAELLERPIPGLAELMRLAGIQKARVNALWRGLAGQRGKSIIINLPAQDTTTAVQAVLPLIPIVLEAIRIEMPIAAHRVEVHQD